jgi:hypothetical protein
MGEGGIGRRQDMATIGFIGLGNTGLPGRQIVKEGTR